MGLAAGQGARVMTLTGLLPSATAYGASIETEHAGLDGQALTTGHALTTAVILAGLVELLRRCGRSLPSEELAVVGLGSVGRSVLELMLRTLPHPRALVLCDLYRNSDAVAIFRRHIEQDLGFRGCVEVVAGDAGLPAAVLDRRLVVAAVDRADLIDPLRLRPGTILLDDSYPAAFSPEIARRRMDEARDVVIATGGFARLPGPVKETIYLPSTARLFVENYGRERFLDHFRREASDYTACVLAGPLALRDTSLKPAVGVPTPEALQAFYAGLERHAIGPATPHCGGQLIPDSLFAAMREVRGDG